MKEYSLKGREFSIPFKQKGKNFRFLSNKRKKIPEYFVIFQGKKEMYGFVHFLFLLHFVAFWL